MKNQASTKTWQLNAEQRISLSWGLMTEVKTENYVASNTSCKILAMVSFNFLKKVKNSDLSQ